MAQRGTPPPPRRSSRLADATLARARSGPPRPDALGLLATAFYVAANGYGSECGGLLCTCVELGHDEGEESVLRGVMTWERKAAGRGERVRPRLCHAALVGDVSRLQRLVRAGAWLMGTEEQGRTALMVAVEEGHAAVVRELLACEGAGGAFVGARVAAGKDGAGHSAFSIACFWTHDSDRKLTEDERAVYATIARLLVGSGHVEPGDLGGGDGTALSWACESGLPDVVTLLLADARCTAAIVAQRDDNGGSPFSIACSWARDNDRKFTEGERAAYGTIARLLVGSGHVRSGDLGGSDDTALSWACESGLPDVVTLLLADARCTDVIVAQRDADGSSPFSIACYWALDHERKLTEGECAVYATIVRLLVGSGRVGPGDIGGNDGTALSWACVAGLPDVVTTLLLSPLCTRAVVIATDDSGNSAFSYACILAADTLEGERKYSVLERAAGAACARSLAASPHLSPADTARRGYTALASACDAGLADIVTTWLADARCTVGVVRQISVGGHTAASLLLARAALTRRLTPTERRDTAACARAVGGCPHVPQACREALMAAAVACEGGGAATQHTGR